MKEKIPMILVTGGAGFIGGNFVLDWLNLDDSHTLINLDALTYAGNLTTLKSIQNNPKYQSPNNHSHESYIKYR
jgi:dTDP-glucose 4,6-dehydratase